MYYVYLVESMYFDEVYTGYTRDIKQRLSDHNSGKVKHTSKYKPWKFVSYIAFDSEEKARNFEKYLKTGSGIALSRKHFL